MAAASLNPHKNVLRNLKKKADSIAALKDRDDLDAAQEDKLKTEKKVLAELAAVEKKYKEWEAANATAAPTSIPAPAAQKQQSAKKEKKPEKKADNKKPEEKQNDASAEQANKLRNLMKKLRAIEDLEEKVAGGHTPDKAQKEKLATKKEIKKQIAELERVLGMSAKPAAKEKKVEKKVEPAKKPAPKKEKAPKADAPQMDQKAEKTTRNRLKNLKAKLDSISELKNTDDLSEDQIAKVKSEKKVKAEIDELTKKLAAFGLSA